jgi:catechol 2,3-dioxygenase-like lactoylglutathione lyase family enzyme
MNLDSYPVSPVIAVSDMETARPFYEGKLGLSSLTEDPDGGRTYVCGARTVIHVYPSPHEVGGSTATRAGWLVDDIEGVVDDLSSKGVNFEEYDESLLRSDERRITASGPVKRAWFRDPDGSYFAITQIDQQ